MIKINLICVGNLKDKEFVAMCDEYIKRTKRFANVCVKEIKEYTLKDNIDLIKQAESAEILKCIDKSSSMLFDVGGESFSSENFAKLIEKHFLTNSVLNLVIGGSFGVDDNVRENVGKRISVSKMTFPHRLFRVMALEQIYRALCILNNTSYHK